MRRWAPSTTLRLVCHTSYSAFSSCAETLLISNLSSVFLQALPSTIFKNEANTYPHPACKFDPPFPGPTGSDIQSYQRPKSFGRISQAWDCPRPHHTGSDEPVRSPSVRRQATPPTRDLTRAVSVPICHALRKLLTGVQTYPRIYLNRPQRRQSFVKLLVTFWLAG